MTKRIASEHGIVCRLPGERLGYFGWPTVARLDDGTLVVASSGLRSEHVCPWGKTVLNVSHDDGRTWSPPRVINDSPLDDRDAGVINLGGATLLVTWFTSDSRKCVEDEGFRKWLGDEEIDSWRPTLAALTDDLVKRHLGSWIMLSNNSGKTWSAPLRSPVSAPHGPVRLRGGEVLYLGKDSREMSQGVILAAASPDGGATWEVRGQVPVYPGTYFANYHEPHVVELPTGTLLGMIRVENGPGADLAPAGVTNFSIMQTASNDGGRTWSVPKPLNFHGSPPHLLRHSSGTLVMTSGCRLASFGQRVAFSKDDGATWEHDWIVRDDGPDWDLGYPSTVEMGDGSLFTVCYQKVPGDRKCSLLWSRWKLPE